jgi:hypothetical protein
MADKISLSEVERLNTWLPQIVQALRPVTSSKEVDDWIESWRQMPEQVQP